MQALINVQEGKFPPKNKSAGPNKRAGWELGNGKVLKCRTNKELFWLYFLEMVYVSCMASHFIVRIAIVNV